MQENERGIDAMAILLRIHIGNDAAFSAEATQAFKEAGIETRTPRRRGGPLPLDIIIALGSAGAFSTVYQIFAKLLDKDKGRAVTIETKNTKISVTGFSLSQVKEFLEHLAEQFEQGTSEHTKPKLDGNDTEGD